MAVSSQSSRCCVCSLFHNPSIFLYFNPQLVLDIYKRLNKKLQGNLDGRKTKSKCFPAPVRELELRVVVQRVLINLPTTSTGKEPSDNESDDDGDELITCNSCGICVHKCKFKCSLLLLKDWFFFFYF